MSTLPPELQPFPEDRDGRDRFALRRRRIRLIVTVLASLALIGMVGGVIINLATSVQNHRIIEQHREQQREDDFYSLPDF